jgi:hypothetical protein
VITRNWNGVAAVIFIAAAFDVAFGQANQTATSSISGRILDVTGTVVPNPSVKLTVFGASDLFTETKGAEEGLFRFGTLPPNKYTVRIEVPGFRAFTKTVETISGKDVDLGSIVLEVLPSTWEPAELPEVEVAPLRTFGGRYTNVDYGFSVVIPDGLVGENDPAPHGFGITWSSGSTLWVDASYEAVPYELGRFNAHWGSSKANGSRGARRRMALRSFTNPSPPVGLTGAVRSSTQSGLTRHRTIELKLSKRSRQ